MAKTVIHDWDVFERKSKTSDSLVFLVYRVVAENGRQFSEYLRNPSPRSRRPRSAARFLSREAAEKARARAMCPVCGSKCMTQGAG